MIEKRGALQEVLKGAGEDERPNTSKVEDDREYAEEQRKTLKVRYKKPNVLTSPTKQV